MSAAFRYEFETSQYRRDRLQAAGVPSDLMSQLANSHSDRFRLSMIGGVIETSAFSFSGGTGYTLSLTLATTIARGIAICDWELRSPLSVRSPIWMTDASGDYPPTEAYVFPDSKLSFDRDLVLNHRKRLDPGHRLEGLLLGTLPESIPGAFKHGAQVDATISLLDEMGRRFSSPVSLWVNRGHEMITRKRSLRRRSGLLVARDPVTIEK